MTRSDNLNWHDHGGYTEITDTSSNVNVLDQGKSKRSIVNENLLQSCSTTNNKSKRTIVIEPLLQNYSAEENRLCSTKEDKSEYASKK